MKRFIQVEHRTQSTLLPEMLDDYVTEENQVRVVDVFVDNLDLKSLGFEGVTPAATDRPSCHPAILLKLYVYGYVNRVQSSHRLKREAQRNVELMWLTGRLKPDFKTIANFRKDNGKATLMELINDPALFRCDIDRVGVTDINLMYTVRWSDLTDLQKNFSMPINSRQFLTSNRLPESGNRYCWPAVVLMNAFRKFTG